MRTLWVLISGFPLLFNAFAFRRKSLPYEVKKLLIRLGPVYIKIGQILSTRLDILPQAYVAEFASLRESVPPEPIQNVETVLRRAYPKGVNSVFTEFEEAPIAAGSIAQVHLGSVNGQKKVAVKILRSGVHSRIRKDFRFIHIVVAIASRLSSALRTVNLQSIVREIEELLLSQTDLRQELANYKLCQKTFERSRSVRVPSVYPELSGPEILVTDYVQAIHPNDYRRLALPPIALAERVDDLMDLMFTEGFCHADLHPGNFFWNRRCQIVLIDLGLVHLLSLEDRSHILSFYYAIAEGFFEFAALHFLTYFVVSSDHEPASKGTHSEALEHTCQLIEHHFVETEGRPKAQNLIPELLVLMSKHHLRLRSSYSKVLLTLITIEGYLYSLDTSFNMLENARKKRIEMAEYTSIPRKAEHLVIGDFGTYSAARFSNDTAPEEAWEERDRYVLDVLHVSEGDFVIDIGCGGGQLLNQIEQRGARALGLTISQAEYEACRERELDCLLMSWEDFNRMTYAHYPQADALAVIEMLFHLATFRENKVGLLDMRLQKFFMFASQRLKDRGRVFIQSLNIIPEFIYAPEFQDEYEDLTEKLPWLGFAVWEQIMENASSYFHLASRSDDSNDLMQTFQFMMNGIEKNERELRRMINSIRYDALREQLDAVVSLADRGILRLNRSLLEKR